MNHDLIERYLYAVTRRLPAKQREDVAEELRGLIQDMLDERCQGLNPTEKDIRVVLTELGSPSELCAQYDPSGKQCLIGPPHYSTYKFVLKVVLLCVAGGITLATGIGQLANPQQRAVKLAGQPGRRALLGLWFCHLIVRLFLPPGHQTGFYPKSG